jgi:hypothetical protein
VIVTGGCWFPDLLHTDQFKMPCGNPSSVPMLGECCDGSVVDSITILSIVLYSPFSTRQAVHDEALGIFASVDMSSADSGIEVPNFGTIPDDHIGTVSRDGLGGGTVFSVSSRGSVVQNCAMLTRSEGYIVLQAVRLRSQVARSVCIVTDAGRNRSVRGTDCATMLSDGHPKTQSCSTLVGVNQWVLEPTPIVFGGSGFDQDEVERITSWDFTHPCCGGAP